MRDDYFWTLMGAGFIVFWALLIAVTRHLRAQQRLRQREMIHRERVLALEKGVPLPAEEPGVVSPGLAGLSLRTLSLVLGFVLLGCGIGLVLAALCSADPSRFARWPFGLIPGMVGIGLLLNAWVGRRIAST
jgi:hypothetical protein